MITCPFTLWSLMRPPKATMWSRHSSHVSKARVEEEEVRRMARRQRRLRIFRLVKSWMESPYKWQPFIHLSYHLVLYSKYPGQGFHVTFVCLIHIFYFRQKYIENVNNYFYVEGGGRVNANIPLLICKYM